MNSSFIRAGSRFCRLVLALYAGTSGVTLAEPKYWDGYEAFIKDRFAFQVPSQDGLVAALYPGRYVHRGMGNELAFHLERTSTGLTLKVRAPHYPLRAYLDRDIGVYVYTGGPFSTEAPGLDEAAVARADAASALVGRRPVSELLASATWDELEIGDAECQRLQDWEKALEAPTAVGDGRQGELDEIEISTANSSASWAVVRRGGVITRLESKRGRPVPALERLAAWLIETADACIGPLETPNWRARKAEDDRR